MKPKDEIVAELQVSGLETTSGYRQANKRLTLEIGGREALPVRAIPHVTGWDLSPDILAATFALHREHRITTLTAYHLSRDSVVSVKPAEWDVVVVNIGAFESELDKKYGDSDIENYAAWRASAVQRLPAGVFVWLDEFQNEYKADRKRMIRCEERRGDDELILEPMLDAEIRSSVMEGFGSLPSMAGRYTDSASVVEAKAPIHIHNNIRLEILAIDRAERNNNAVPKSPTNQVDLGNKKILKSDLQDAEILNWLRANEYDPLALPVTKLGTSGVRKKCGDAVCGNMQLFSSRSVFDTTWDRLRANGKTNSAK